jgi:mono/diheme cytochrome c family protein
MRFAKFTLSRVAVAGVALASAAVAGCDRAPDASPSTPSDTLASEARSAPMRVANGSVALAGANGAVTVADSLLLAEGQKVVRTLCVACHSEQPPAKLAPPLAHISRRYRMVLGDRDSAIARITAWVQAPAKERALMPSMAIERFGLMAPFPIPEAQRRAAAAYVWSLSEGAAGAMDGAMIHDSLPTAEGMVRPSAAAPRAMTPARIPPDL